MDEDEGEVEQNAEPAELGESAEPAESTEPAETVETAESDLIPEDDTEKKKVKEKKEKRPSKKERTSSLGTSQQQLFLVEFLVDTVAIDSCSVDEEVLEGQTCLSLSFLNFPPMEICEKDFNPNKESCPDKVRFNCGKSLMFAFNENQCEHPPPLAVEITVFKKLGEGQNSVKVEIGIIKICISELFHQIVDIAKFKPEKLPTSKSIKDCFMLIGPGKRTMGQVSVYIRLSCLGQNVVTEFQCGPDLKKSPVLFKNKEGRKVFEFTGSEALADGDEASKGRVGCPCHPSNAQVRGGQGDGGRSPSVNASYTQGNRIVLDIPDRSKKNEKEAQKELGASGNRKRGQEGGMNKVRAGNGMTVSQINTNPNQNIFVLKVGDKGMIPDRGKMILEFKSPKQKILPKILPPYHEDAAVQTDTGKKGKGKKKK